MPYQNKADKAANALARYHTPAGKAAHNRRAAKYLSSPKGRAYQRRTAKEMRRRYPEKVKARDLVNYAIRRGYLTKRPCEVCCSKKVEAHHTDYSKPLKVRWLCRKHHRKLHGRKR